MLRQIYRIKRLSGQIIVERDLTVYESHEIPQHRRHLPQVRLIGDDLAGIPVEHQDLDRDRTPAARIPVTIIGAIPDEVANDRLVVRTMVSRAVRACQEAIRQCRPIRP